MGAGRLVRRVRRVGRETMPGFHGFCSFYSFGAIRGVPLFFFYVASLRRCVRHVFCFSRSAAWPYRCVKIFCLTQRRNDATLIRVSGSRIAPLVERGIIRRNTRSTAIAPLYAPYRVDIVGCADEGGASFANDGLRKLSPSYGPENHY